MRPLKLDSRVVLQAQMQRSLDTQPRAPIGRRSRKEAAADGGGQRGSPVSEQDSGILDVEDEEDYEVGE